MAEKLRRRGSYEEPGGERHAGTVRDQFSSPVREAKINGAIESEVKNSSTLKIKGEARRNSHRALTKIPCDAARMLRFPRFSTTENSRSVSILRRWSRNGQLSRAAAKLRRLALSRIPKLHAISNRMSWAVPSRIQRRRPVWREKSPPLRLRAVRKRQAPFAGRERRLNMHNVNLFQHQRRPATGGLLAPLNPCFRAGLLQIADPTPDGGSQSEYAVRA